ncbi:D-alanine--D-alanine ligase [Blastococcus sp. MG754426]|uniref:D-alanine--D-alanine ligase family protein n=1 Tax=unclassified Blastococcus TaxID=2619396 RepID=UPI001EF10393|nr:MULTISPECIES: D-alanine--D-alanine ligase [unclassified Blastococcus]MCF6509870.1 D-alanine--D-alanine ligase [Blastococcus sp. MG754426]MCF6514193.1 D-alanine--D-alanine ligase [Blastococcus sp. MG754427]MCF6737442.1 D-alanine--D-alanine ligase [Blastococcus sp. KM273129]
MSETAPTAEPAAAEERHPLRAVVLAGGLTFEREVSLSSGTQVVEELTRAGVDAELRDADADLLPGLAAAPADAVFIALHGATGEDGALRAVLDLAGVPYVGSPAAACRLAWDKPAAKSVVRTAGLTTPDWVALPHSTFRELGAGAVLDLMVARLGLPLMVKPASGGSALGVQKVSRVEDLPAAMVSCFAYGDTVMVERYVEGVEVALAVIDLGEGPVALPAVEIEPESGVFDYSSRYSPGLTEYHAPARIPDDVAARAAEVAVRVHEVLGLADLSRTDAIITPDGEVHFLEVNVSPGLTETSMFPMAVEAAGYDLGTVLGRLLARRAGNPG